MMLSKVKRMSSRNALLNGASSENQNLRIIMENLRLEDNIQQEGRIHQPTIFGKQSQISNTKKNMEFKQQLKDIPNPD